MLDMNVFSDFNCKKAILKFNGNVQKATHWLLMQQDDYDSEEDEEEEIDNKEEGL